MRLDMLTLTVPPRTTRHMPHAFTIRRRADGAWLTRAGWGTGEPRIFHRLSDMAEALEATQTGLDHVAIVVNE